MEAAPAAPAARAPVLVAFRCPSCAVAQGVDLLAFSKRGSVACAGCNRKLTHTQVSRAIERERRPAGAGPAEPAGNRRLWA